VKRLLVILFVIVFIFSCKKEKITEEVVEDVCIQDTIVTNFTIDPIDYFPNFIENTLFYDMQGNPVNFTLYNYSIYLIGDYIKYQYAIDMQCYIDHIFYDCSHIDLRNDDYQVLLGYFLSSYSDLPINDENTNLLRISVTHLMQGNILLPDTTGTYEYNLKERNGYAFLDSLQINSYTYYNVYSFEENYGNDHYDLYFNFEYGIIKFTVRSDSFEINQ